jgi:hypothetical protein
MKRTSAGQPGQQGPRLLSAGGPDGGDYGRAQPLTPPWSCSPGAKVFLSTAARLEGPASGRTCTRAPTWRTPPRCCCPSQPDQPAAFAASGWPSAAALRDGGGPAGRHRLEYAVFGRFFASDLNAGDPRRDHDHDRDGAGCDRAAPERDSGPPVFTVIGGTAGRVRGRVGGGRQPRPPRSPGPRSWRPALARRRVAPCRPARAADLPSTVRAGPGHASGR